MATRIELWYDTTSDPDDPRWIVSRETLDQGGEPTASDTVKVFDPREEKEAARFGRELAEREGVPFEWRNQCISDGGIATCKTGGVYRLVGECYEWFPQ